MPSIATRAAALIAAALALAACSSTSPDADAATSAAGAPDPAIAARLDLIQAAVTDWADAPSLADAKAAAERARNLVVGPDNELYGDADADGTVGGVNDEGLLPGEGGEPGLAQEGEPNACVVADVLGGDWADPAARWTQARDTYAAWTPADNTMPRLASHPQRIVGWATLTFAADSLDTAHEFAGHAQLHVDVSVAAVEDCDG